MSEAQRNAEKIAFAKAGESLATSVDFAADHDEIANLADKLMTMVHLDIIRRLLSAQLPGGEDEFWGMVASDLQELA